MIRIAINGYGRIGKCILRSIFEYNRNNIFDIVAINDISSNLQSIMYLTKYDSIYGNLNCIIQKDQHDNLIIDKNIIKVISEKYPEKLPWKELNVDLVFECTGKFTTQYDAMKHIIAGAKRVIISAPGDYLCPTIVYGINHKNLKITDRVISNSSCTTNCLSVLIGPLLKHLGIQYGLLNTIHSYTQDQMLLDGNHNELRRARSATQSIIPTKTGAAIGVGNIFPELIGKLDGFAMRVPTTNTSIVDFTFIANKSTSVSEVNYIIQQYKSNILHINEEPLVSCDFKKCTASAIFDATQTKVLHTLVKVVAWYDNEWGFSNRMLDVAEYFMRMINGNNN